MSITHADNFNIYGSSTAEMTASGRYAEVTASTLAADPDGVHTERVLRKTGNGTIRRVLATPATKVGMAGRFWFSFLPVDNDQRPNLFEWNDASNNPMARVKVNTTGAMQFELNDDVVGWQVIETTPGPVITAGAWWHIAAQMDFGGGNFTLQVEGINEIDVDEADWGGFAPLSDTMYQGQFRSAANSFGASPLIYLKDYVWWDGLGTENNDFPGSVLVAQLDPIADVTIGGWVPSTGTAAWSILDNDPASSPYLSADNTPPAAMELELENLPADVTSVKALVTLVRAAKTDGGDGTLQVSLISEGVEAPGADRPITAAQAYWEDIQELDPDTGAAWLPDAVDGATLKIDRTS